MLNAVVTGKVISTNDLGVKGAFCGRFMLRISQRVKGEFKHALIECWIPVAMVNSFNWLQTTKTEYLVVVADVVSRPSVWEHEGLEVIAALSVTRLERN